MMKEQDIVLSIKKHYANLILTGDKKVELRVRFPIYIHTLRPTAFIYATAPAKAIVGQVEVAEWVKLHPDDIWSQFKESACISEKNFKAYFGTRPTGYVLFLSRPRRYYHPVDLDYLRRSFNFTAPQSWGYASERLSQFLKKQ